MPATPTCPPGCDERPCTIFGAPAIGFFRPDGHCVGYRRPPCAYCEAPVGADDTVELGDQVAHSDCHRAEIGV